MTEDTYDVILLGTGLTECIIGGVLATHGYRILHLDRNPFYGGEGASLNLSQVFERFGRTRSSLFNTNESYEYNIDLIPKVLLAAGDIVKLMEKTIIDRYNMDLHTLDGSFMMRDGKYHEVPSSEQKAFLSGLMGLWEKWRVAKFFRFCKNYDPKKEKMHSQTMAKVFEDYGLSGQSINFIGHAVALHDNDDYLQRPAEETILKCQLYNLSLQAYGNSPYMYPNHGMGEVPSYFARLGAVHGGVYCLGTQIEQMSIESNMSHSVDFTGQDYSGKETKHRARAKWLIGDPSYFPDVAPVKHEILRCICITSVKLEQLTLDYHSMQLIIPGSELKRKNDIFVLQLDRESYVVPRGKFLVFISTVLEAHENPTSIANLVLSLLCCHPIEIFVRTQEYREPSAHEMQNVAITKSPDSASHFENSAKDIDSILMRIHGKGLSELYNE
ncbi:RAB GDP dissociation inhibitor alpha [Perkinsela sp. CCAP 1560/4]|nr:RAB GDP dissociation inhibitor alpha [Perkinsela sp. CCAP 1560/4]|eukprot:KNH05727.1 RAB GDP dissociation inhibitor alpha [Perkinsela sp. CCAP 1560/4]